MQLQTEHEGTEVWVCPTCGRTLLIEWDPNFKKTVSVSGNDNASHSGSKGGLVMGVQMGDV